MCIINNYMNANKNSDKVTIKELMEFVNTPNQHKPAFSNFLFQAVNHIEELVYPELKEIRKDTKLYDVKDIIAITGSSKSNINNKLRKSELIKYLGDDYQLGKSETGRNKSLFTLNGVRKMTAYLKNTEYTLLSSMSIAELQEFTNERETVDKIKKFKGLIKNQYGKDDNFSKYLIDNFESLIEPEIVNLKHYKNIIANLKEENLKLKGKHNAKTNQMMNYLINENEYTYETQTIIDLLTKQDKKLDELLALKKDTNK
jgi:uncharacterized membrane protein